MSAPQPTVTLSVNLTPAQAQQLDAFAERCGVSGKVLAETFIESGLRRTIPQPRSKTPAARAPATKVVRAPRAPVATFAAPPRPVPIAPPEPRQRAEPPPIPKPRKDGRPPCPANPLGGHNLAQEPGAGFYAPFTCRDCGFVFEPPHIDLTKPPTSVWRRPRPEPVEAGR